jgi:hypothetical protein
MIDLKNLSKHSFFTKAYLFFSLKKALMEIFEKYYPNLLENLKNSEVHFRQQKDKIILAIYSENLSFMTFLKTEKRELQDLLKSNFENNLNLNKNNFLNLNSKEKLDLELRIGKF